MRESLRVFKSQPGFAAAAVLALGLGMAANTALFTVVNSLLFRPLPFPDSEQLAEISIGERQADLEQLKDAPMLESVGAFVPWNFSVRDVAGVPNAYGFRVTPDLIPLLKLRPALGRALTRADAGRNVVMISHELWERLGRPADYAGIILTLDGERYGITGVLPADFFLGVRDARLIVPNLRSGERTIARLQPGVSAAEAQARIAALNPGSRIEVTPLARALRGNDGRPVLFLLATAGFVLLITSVNLANLQLARGLGRRREFAIRTAMGASFGRLAGQLAAESAGLAAAGAALGLLLTRVFESAILAALPVNITRRLAGGDALAIDARVLAFTAAIAFTTILLFGLLPAFASLRFDPMRALRDRAGGWSAGRHRYGQVLATVEIALALMLLAGAGLTFKSLTQLENQYLGFRPEGVLRAMAAFSSAGLYYELERRMNAMPGISGVGIVAPQAFPFGGPGVRGSRMEIHGQPGVEARAEVYAANPAYLHAIRLPLKRGRWFTAADSASSPPVAVLSETVAHRYWGNQDCIGRKVRLNSDRAESGWATIVGVAGDVRNPAADSWQPTAYRPFAQTPSAAATLLIRTSAGDPLSVASVVRRELKAIEPAAPELRIVAALDAAVHDYVSPQRFTTWMMAVFAAIGLALAANGVYAVMRYWVASRTGEIGIRMALGAQRSNVLRLVLGRAANAAAFGVAAGLAGAIALRKLIATQLTGVSAADPLVLGAVAAAIFITAVVAAWLPARRASRIAPAEALRAE